MFGGVGMGCVYCVRVGARLRVSLCTAVAKGGRQTKQIHKSTSTTISQTPNSNPQASSPTSSRSASPSVRRVANTCVWFCKSVLRGPHLIIFYIYPWIHSKRLPARGRRDPEGDRGGPPPLVLQHLWSVKKKSTLGMDVREKKAGAVLTVSLLRF